MSLKIAATPNSPLKVQLARLSHVYLRHPDTEQFKKFAADFGLVEAHRDGDVVYFRGYGKDQYCYVLMPSVDGKKKFEGGAWALKSKDDFEKALKLPGATRSDLNHLPGGGEMVSIPSPGGALIHLVWGQGDRETLNHEASAIVKNLGPYNKPFTKERKGEFQRFELGPAMVHKLGHYGFSSGFFDEDIKFYLENFNFTPSDILYDPRNSEMDVLTFIHLDLGEEYSDHHSLFLQRGPPGEKAILHHCSFEVADFDTQLIGHEWLAHRGYEIVWGVGRHILGSQIFDYWKDPSGFKIEHYADGDVVNAKTPVKRQGAGPDTLSIWGPPLPPSFTEAE